MSKKIKIPIPTKGYGYAGEWLDGRIGWFMPRHVYGSYDRKCPDDPVSDETREFLEGRRLFLFEIIVRPLKDKKGRPITKIVPEIKKA